MTLLTIAEQTDRILSRWPQFRLVAATKFWGCWEGPVVSFEKQYIIRVWYAPLGQIGEYQVPTSYPDVYVVGEKLRYFGKDAQGNRILLPHFNWRKMTPSLCCFDPKKGDWDPNKAIADSIILFAANWLRHYELWCSTGKWSGPESTGVDLNYLLNRGKRKSAAQQNPDLEARVKRRDLSKLGLGTMTSAFCLSTEAASRGYYRPQFLKTLRNCCPPAALLQTTSTTSQELPLAA